MSKHIVDQIRAKAKPADDGQTMHDDSCPACGRRDDMFSHDGEEQAFPEQSYDMNSVAEELPETDNKKRLKAILGKVSRMKK